MYPVGDQSYGYATQVLPMRNWMPRRFTKQGLVREKRLQHQQCLRVAIQCGVNQVM